MLHDTSEDSSHALVHICTHVFYHFSLNHWTCSLVTCSSSQWAGRLGWSASSLPAPPPPPLLVAPPLLNLLWHCPLPLHGGREQPCFTGGTGTAEGCCTTHHLSAQLCTSAVSCTSLHAPLHWLCRWTVTVSTQVTGGLTTLSLSLWALDTSWPLCEEDHTVYTMQYLHDSYTHTHWQALGTDERWCQHHFSPGTHKSQNHPQLLMRWPALRPQWYHQHHYRWSDFEWRWWLCCPPGTTQFVGGVFPWHCRLGSVLLQLLALGCCPQCHHCLQQWWGELQNML